MAPLEAGLVEPTPRGLHKVKQREQPLTTPPQQRLEQAEHDREHCPVDDRAAAGLAQLQTEADEEDNELRE